MLDFSCAGCIRLFWRTRSTELWSQEEQTWTNLEPCTTSGFGSAGETCHEIWRADQKASRQFPSTVRAHCRGAKETLWSSGFYFSDPLANCIFSYHLRCHAHKQSAQATKNKPSAHHRHFRHHHVHHRTTHQTNRHTLRMLVMRSLTMVGMLGYRRRRERFGEAKRKSSCSRCGQR